MSIVQIRSLSHRTDVRTSRDHTVQYVTWYFLPHPTPKLPPPPLHSSLHDLRLDSFLFPAEFHQQCQELAEDDGEVANQRRQTHAIHPLHDEHT